MTTKEAIIYEKAAIREASIRAIKAKTDAEFRKANKEVTQRKNLLRIMEGIERSFGAPKYVRAYTPESYSVNQQDLIDIR